QERWQRPPEQVALAYFEQSELDVQVCAEAATWHTPSSQLRRPGKALQSALTVLALHWFAFVSTMSEHDVSAAKQAAAAPPTIPRRRSRPHAPRPPHVRRRPCSLALVLIAPSPGTGRTPEPRAMIGAARNKPKAFAPAGHRFLQRARARDAISPGSRPAPRRPPRPSSR